MVPLLVVACEFTRPTSDTWHHFTSALLPGYLRNTLLLMAGAGAGTFITWHRHSLAGEHVPVPRKEIPGMGAGDAHSYPGIYKRLYLGRNA
jgi:hypothetical protein